MNENWFWRSGDEIRGPLSVADLEQLSTDGMLGEEDFVRQGESGEWQPARRVAQRFDRRTKAIAAGSASDAAAKVIADANRGILRPSLAGGAEGPARRNLLHSIPTGFKSIAETIGERLGSVVGFGLDRVFSASGRIATLVVVLALLAVVMLRLTGLSDTSISRAHAEYMSLWGEIRELRTRSAAKEEWDALERRAHDRLAPLVADLEETQQSNPTNKPYWLASSRVRANLRNELIAAGKSDLPAVLRGGRNEESVAENRFGKSMQRLALYLDGKDPYPAPKKKKGVATVKSQAKFDYASAGIVAIDMLLVAGGFMWWIKRRRR